MEKILITGVSGHLGGEVLNRVLQKTDSKHGSAMARDLSKISQFKSKGIELRKGDYDDFNSLLKAFNGIDKLYFVSGSDIQNREKQHENIVKAAVESGIKHVVYTSFQRRDETGKSPIAMVAGVHIKTEKWLKESGLKYTIMRHALYMDGLPMFLGDKFMETGTIFLPAGNGKSSYTMRSDMAEAGAVILTSGGHENKSYEISGGQSYSFDDIAAILSSITGKSIRYVSPTTEEFSKTMAEAGVPEDYIGFILSFSRAMQVGEFDFPGNKLEKLIGHKPTEMKEFLKKMYSK